ncbi:MAG: hypothetical protein U1F43_01165 [Myxococcota bacterium]
MRTLHVMGVVFAFASACIASDRRTASTVASDSASGDDGAGDATSADTGSDSGVDGGDGVVTSPPDTIVDDTIVTLPDSVQADSVEPPDAVVVDSTGCAGCLIGGTCYDDGVADPDNACRVCAVGADAFGWTGIDGDPGSCDDGDACTYEDRCEAGACTGTLDTCVDAYACTLDFCDGACVHVVNSTSCLIAGTCYADGQRSAPCQICDSSNPLAWSIDEGHSCDDVDPCTSNDECGANGQCVGTKRVIGSEPNEDVDHATVLGSGVTSFPAGTAQGNINPLSDRDWFSWGQPIQSPDGVFIPTASLSGSIPGNATLCVYAVCNQSTALFAQPVVVCDEEATASTVGVRAGCCRPAVAGQSVEVRAPATCVGAVVQGFGYASVTTNDNVQPNSATCGDYQLKWGARKQQ